ncbi:nucleoside phosphorylase domain-containing protein, partial [Elsinoe ampelina]
MSALNRVDDEKSDVKERRRDDYRVGIVCALGVEEAAVTAMLDSTHLELPGLPSDDNFYRFGTMSGHDVVVTCLPAGVIGKVESTRIANNMRHSFPAVEIVLMVGVGGGVPSRKHDIRLGDIVVSQPEGSHPGLVEWDAGKAGAGGFVRRGSLNRPNRIILHCLQQVQGKHTAEDNVLNEHISGLRKRQPHLEPAGCKAPDPQLDILFSPEYVHPNEYPSCHHCDKRFIVERMPRVSSRPFIFYGNIGSGDQVVKDAVVRDNIARQYDLLCFEMEAVGIANAFESNYLVIRGICDYADSHKNKIWQPWAAMRAAWYAKEFLCVFKPARTTRPVPDTVNDSFLSTTNNYSPLMAKMNGGLKRSEGTCQWIFQDENYQSWCEQGGLLWLSGKPGAGKSTLMKAL